MLCAQKLTFFSKKKIKINKTFGKVVFLKNRISVLEMRRDLRTYTNVARPTQPKVFQQTIVPKNQRRPRRRTRSSTASPI